MTDSNATPPPEPSVVTIISLAGLASPLFFAALSAVFYFTHVDPPVLALAFALSALFDPIAMWIVLVSLRQRVFDAQQADLDGYLPPTEDRPRLTPTFVTLALVGGITATGLFAVGLLLGQSQSPGADAPLFGLWLVVGIATALFAGAAFRTVGSS